MTRVIAFDLDGTLAVSKSPISDTMAALLAELIHYYHIVIMTGGNLEQIRKQVCDRLDIPYYYRYQLSLMPTSGASLYRWNNATEDFELVYSNELSAEQKDRIIIAINSSVDRLGYNDDIPPENGPKIEDRGAQITFSALGQSAPIEQKQAWDPDCTKKQKLRDLIAEIVPEFEVRVGGTTSIDVTLPGIDKGYGIKRFSEITGVGIGEFLFIGDRLEPGGNDYPVKELGVTTVPTKGPDNTENILRCILDRTKTRLEPMSDCYSADALNERYGRDA